MPIHLIIFDLDGTLIDSIVDITSAVNYALEPYGIAPVTAEEATTMVGEGSLKLIERVLARRCISLDKKVLSGRFVEYYTSHLTEHTSLYQGVREMLSCLRSYRKALVSNKFASLITGILEEFGLSQHFNLVLGGDMFKERKPSPMPILHVLSTLNVKREEAVVVGDSDVDIAAGRAACVRTVAATYGYGRPGFEKGADFSIGHIMELVDIVLKLA